MRQALTTKQIKMMILVTTIKRWLILWISRSNPSNSEISKCLINSNLTQKNLKETTNNIWAPLHKLKTWFKRKLMSLRIRPWLKPTTQKFNKHSTLSRLFSPSKVSISILVPTHHQSHSSWPKLKVWMIIWKKTNKKFKRIHPLKQISSITLYLNLWVIKQRRPRCLRERIKETQILRMWSQPRATRPQPRPRPKRATASSSLAWPSSKIQTSPCKTSRRKRPSSRRTLTWTRRMSLPWRRDWRISRSYCPSTNSCSRRSRRSPVRRSKLKTYWSKTQMKTTRR